MGSRGLNALEVAVAAGLLVVLGLAVFPMHHGCHEASGRVKCANNLRWIGISAIQYADDKRFFPHVGKTGDLDGDASSSDTPTAMRSLVFYGYMDNSEALVCPDSDDLYLPITDPDVLDDMRRWSWGGAYYAADAAATQRPPWLTGRGKDPALEDTDELSYAYTRRGYTSSSAGTQVLGADRARRVAPLGAPPPAKPGHTGNHLEGWNVLHADASVRSWSANETVSDGQGGSAEPREFLTGTEKGQGFLPLSSAPR